jgi:membrane-bound serine protease (ClpP class)
MIRIRKIIPAVLLLLAVFPGRTARGETANRILWMKAEGPVSAVMAGYIERGVKTAGSGGYEFAVLQLNTPGGQIDLMERIVTALRESKVPVVVYVAPRGAMAGSAGTVITLAGHVAAMAPETAIGAASPVGSQGEDLGSTLQTKEKEILRALIRSLTENRPPEAIALAESTIEQAKAVSSTEALQAGLIDIIADSPEDLLRQLDGRPVKMGSQEVVLRTTDATIVNFQSSFIELLLQVLTNPNIVFILLAVGAQAVLIELSHPGGWVAGFIGAVCLVLAFYGMGFLPVNWLGAVFIILAFVLFIVELQSPTHGAMAVAGGGSFIAGALILFNSSSTPEFQRVSVPLVFGVGLAFTTAVLLLFSLAWRARRLPLAVGGQALIGKPGEVRQALHPRGMVQAAGELWSAESEDGTWIEEGTPVEVVRVSGVRIIVRKDQ